MACVLWIRGFSLSCLANLACAPPDRGLSGLDLPIFLGQTPRFQCWAGPCLRTHMRLATGQIRRRYAEYEGLTGRVVGATTPIGAARAKLLTLAAKTNENGGSPAARRGQPTNPLRAQRMLSTWNPISAPPPRSAAEQLPSVSLADHIHMPRLPPGSLSTFLLFCAGAPPRLQPLE